MKLTKSQLKQIIKEELSYVNIGASRSPEEVFKSANDSLTQAHEDLQMLSLHLKNAGFDVQEVEGLVSNVGSLVVSLRGLTADDVAAITQGV